jgi:hypothetical protein
MSTETRRPGCLGGSLPGVVEARQVVTAVSTVLGSNGWHNGVLPM